MVSEHGCVDGYVFDRNLKQKVPCEICKRERAEYAHKGLVQLTNGDLISVYDYLGSKEYGLSERYSDEYIIGKADLYYLEPTTVQAFNKGLDIYLSYLLKGQIPKYSVMLYAGRHARLDALAVNILLSAYKGGLTIAPIVTYAKLLGKGLDPRVSNEEDLYLDSDVCVAILTSGISNIGSMLFRGLMQERAVRGKPTILLLSDKYDFQYILRSLTTLDTPRLDLAVYLGVTYRDVDMKQTQELLAKKSQQISNSLFGLEQPLDVFYSDSGGVGLDPQFESERKVFNAYSVDNEVVERLGESDEVISEDLFSSIVNKK